MSVAASQGDEREEEGMKPSGILSRFRFTLAEILGVITVIAICAGAFAKDSHFAELALRYFAFSLVLAAALRALFSGPLRRPFATAFAVGTMLHWSLAADGPHKPGTAEIILGVLQSGQQHFSQLNMLHISLSLAFGALAGVTARLLVRGQSPPA